MVMAAAETPAIEGLAMELLETVGWGRSRDWRGVFTGAATAAAVAERRAIETRFPSGEPDTVPLRPGRYANAATGAVRIEAGVGGLQLFPEQAPDFENGRESCRARCVSTCRRRGGPDQ